MSESEYRTFEALSQAAEIILGGLAKQGKLRTDFRQVAWPNPLFNQLTRGLCLELVPNGAIHFWTPWGDWNAGLASPDSFGEKPEIPGLILSHFIADDTLRPQAPRSRVFAIHQSKNLILPQPIQKPLTEYRTPSDISRRWPELLNMWRTRRRFAA